MATKRIIPTAGTLSDGEPLIGLIELKNNLFLNLTFLLASILILAPSLGPVPSANENVYLLYMAQQWDPNLLSKDWTFAGPLPSHWIFNFVFGSLTVIFSLETAGWIGRFLSWSLISIALLQLGRHFALPMWMTSLSIFLWLLYGQSPVGGEWILGTFEAKCIAYIFVFFSLNAFMKGKDFVGSFLLGLSLTFHAVIGMWALLAAGLSLIALRYAPARLLKLAGCMLLGAAPGLIVSLPIISGGWSLSDQEAKFLALVAAPFHLDPLYFPKRDVFVLFILMGFNWLYFRTESDSKALRFLNYFLTFLGLFFLMGVIARVTGQYQFLKYFPLRLFPVLVPLFFFLSLFALCRNHELSASAVRRLIPVGILALLCLPNPVGRFIDEAAAHYRMWKTYYDYDNLQKSFLWVSEKTPRDSTVILPPWRKESFYLSKRATVAHWATPRMDHFKEWQDRVRLLMGDFSQEKEKNIVSKMQDHYNHLADSEIASMASKYGGDYLISEGAYSYPILYDTGTYRVYALSTSALQASRFLDSTRSPISRK